MEQTDTVRITKAPAAQHVRAGKIILAVVVLVVVFAGGYLLGRTHGAGPRFGEGQGFERGNWQENSFSGRGNGGSAGQTMPSDNGSAPANADTQGQGQ